MNIAIVGLGHTGEIYSACLSDLGNIVIGIDANKRVVENLNKGIPPFAEPQISELLQKNLKHKRLSYTTDFAQITDNELIWITVDTPINKGAKGSTKKLYVYLQKMLPYLKDGSNVVISSQLPAGTSNEILRFITLEKPKIKFQYAYLPENLRLGEGVDSFMKPSRVIVGTESEKLQKTLTKVFEPLTNNIITVSVPSAEMIKHATNAFLATSMSFIYDIADVCEAVGADVTEVSRGLRGDNRIGEKAYVDASTGFSGGHLERDLHYLRKIAKENQIKLPVVSAVVEKNTKRSSLILTKTLPILRGFKGKTITFFGITYKSGTPVLTHSLPLKVAKAFLSEGAHIRLYDPWVIPSEIEKELPKNTYSYFNDPYESIKGSHALVCVTPWPALKELDFNKMAEKMKGAKIFFDARNYFVSIEQNIKKAGFSYVGVGRKNG